MRLNILWQDLGYDWVNISYWCNFLVSNTSDTGCCFQSTSWDSYLCVMCRNLMNIVKLDLWRRYWKLVFTLICQTDWCVTENSGVTENHIDSFWLLYWWRRCVIERSLTLYFKHCCFYLQGQGEGGKFYAKKIQVYSNSSTRSIPIYFTMPR